jgi:hypothetical protein
VSYGDVVLICQGTRCNPQIRHVDTAVMRDRLLDATVLSEDTKRALRALRYTAHRMVSAVSAQCAECGHERRYGNSL